jgi:hypothetical protein
MQLAAHLTFGRLRLHLSQRYEAQISKETHKYAAGCMYIKPILLLDRYITLYINMV